MGLPIFFEPSKPNPTPERAEKPASDTRSGIRRLYVPVNDFRTVQNARRRRALLGLEHLEGNHDNFLHSQDLNPIATLTSHFGVTGTEMRRNHMPRAARSSRAPTIPRHERQSAGSMEADGPSMPAVPESRDYVTPVSFGVPQRTFLLLDSTHEGRRDSRRMARRRQYSTPPHTETDINSIPGTRTSEVPAEREINERNMDYSSPSNPILFNRFTALMERDDGMTRYLSTQDHSIVRQLRRLVRERDDAELVQEEMIRVRDLAQERQRQLDDDIREERRVERRLEERRRLEEIRERAQARIPAHEPEREQELDDPLHAPESLSGSLALYVNTIVEQAGRALFEPVEGGREEAARQVGEVQQDSATHFHTMMYQARRRVEQVERERERVQDEVERAREQVERARERVERLREQRDEVERAQEGRLAHFDGRGFVNQIEQSSVDGLGDRERSLSPGAEGSWNAILITPDPQPPSASSSFASTAASRSQRDSANTPAGSSPGAVASFRTRFYEPPTDSNGNITYRESGVPNNGDCDTIEPPGDPYSLMDLYRMNQSRRRERGALAGFPLQFEQ
ncbi:hypothetical protein DSL72_002744 [Monilinia vaccinii-corymbosi]|uniref:Uncharacterized protein n=1 Tax=Monilinia vaccinii-corymbosi TaxID=61207 RepID=A0A8A3PDH0_9HELO|nr:hypothetical protein DSL72_002744 [Monilinia vaccinii-corymbosi]